MFAAGKPAWYLPFILFAFLFVSFTGLGYWYNENASSAAQHPHSLAAIFSSETINALNRDVKLQDVLLSLTETIADTSTNLGERFRLHRLKRFGADLTNGITHLRTIEHRGKRKRRMVQDMSSFVGCMPRVGAGVGGGMNATDELANILGGISGSIIDSLTTPALFLGIGLGYGAESSVDMLKLIVASMGAATGLNLTDMETANAQGAKVVSTYNASATGANLAAQNFGTGLAGQIVPFIGTSNVSFGAAAYAMASGIGNAVAYGLNLTQEQALPSNSTGIEAAAGNFGLGITQQIVSQIKTQAIMKNLSGAGASIVAEQLPQIAAAAGRGLGEGARNGLKLITNVPPSVKKRQFTSNSSSRMADIDILETVGSFAKGLSESFLTGNNLTKLGLISGMNLTSMIDVQSMLRPLAAGAGAGIGMGVAIGLKWKSPDAQYTLGGKMTGADAQTALVAEGFVQNMLSNFILDSNAPEHAGAFFTANRAKVFPNADPAKAAEGFARGAIEGVMSAMSSVGGLKNLISGDVPANALENMPVLEPSKFDDSVNGSATGFARGFMGPGTILAAEVIRNLTQRTQNATVVAPMHRRTNAKEYSVVSLNSLSSRQDQEGTSALPGFPVAFDAPTLQMATQKAVDTLTCQGIGGLASLGLGAMNGVKAKAALMGVAQSSVPLDPRILQSLPDDPITLMSEGNNFKIVVKEVSLEINGLRLIPFAVLTALHVFSAGMAFLTFLPLYLIFGVVWRFSVLAGHPVDEAKNRKWRMGFLITFFVFGVVGISCGIIGMGKASHLRDTHAIVGLISLILLFPTTIFSVIRLRTTTPHPSPASFAGIKGPIALAKTPQRIYLVSGILTQLLLAIGQFAYIQGFTTLRSISLCIVDAVLTSNIVAGLISFVLMIQISATALIGIRAWLEQHIAKREAAGHTSNIEAARKSSIQTFGFDRKDPPPALDMSFKMEKPQLIQRNTEELIGYEDKAIGTPFNVRKEGSIVSPLEPEQRGEERRIYNPKTGAYDYDFDNNNGFYAFPVSHAFSTDLSPTAQRYGGRRSSDTFVGPKTTNVTTRDLFPPPKPEVNEADLYPMQTTNKSSIYSRAVDGKSVVGSDGFGMGGGPGVTIRRV